MSLSQTAEVRIWICGAVDAGAVEGRVVGTSQPALAGSAFPQSGLTPAMQAAIRGDIDLLLLEHWALLGATPDRVQALVQTFLDYGVEVKSRCNRGSSSS